MTNGPTLRLTLRPTFRLCLILPLLFAAAAAEAKVSLPAKAPIPEIRTPAIEELTGGADIPVPEARPQPAPDEAAPLPPPTREDEGKPVGGAPPAEKPASGKPVSDKQEPAPKPVTPPDPRAAIRPDPSGKMPEAETACRRDLSSLGATFQDRPALGDPAGCSVPYPLVLKSVGTGIDIAPGPEMNCPMALAAARFARDVIRPAAKAEFGQDLKSISQASAYVCRPRNGTTKLSEHAFGNALDIAAFTLADGKTVNVEPAPDEKAAKFLAVVRKAACGPFKTVLGPGSDADHALHFHFDLAPRRNGGTFCQ